MGRLGSTCTAPPLANFAYAASFPSISLSSLRACVDFRFVFWFFLVVVVFVFVVVVVVVVVVR
jgi:hypothetical protein